MNALKADAIAMRKQGYSYALISQKLGVSKSSMSYWFKDIPFSPNEIVKARMNNAAMRAGAEKHNARLKETQALQEAGIAEVGKISKRDLWIMGLGVYLGEGAKTTEGIRLTNSDPLVIRLAVRWLKDICGLNDENFSLRIHAYPDTDMVAAQKYWEGVTGLLPDNFRRANIDRRSDKRTSHAGKLPYGTLHVSVVSRGDPEKGVRLFRKISGWMTGVLGQV